MALPQQEFRLTAPDGLTGPVSSPIISTHHDIHELPESQSSYPKTHSTPISTGSGVDVKSSSMAPQPVSPIDAGQVHGRGELIPDTVSEASHGERDERRDSLGLVPLDEGSQASVDSSYATLSGAHSTKQSFPSPSSTEKKSAIAVTEGSVFDHDEAKPIQRPPIIQSLGIWGCATIAGGTALTVAVLGFLIFLWAGEGPAGGEKATYVWRKIMLSESWPAQTITICSLVVRTVAVGQAAVCTSLVAALLLERRRLPLSKAIPVSISRGVNDGPFNFLRELFTRRYIRPFFCIEMILLLIVTVLTFGTQFTSTILLSGFGTTTLVHFPQQLHQNVLLSAEAATKAHLINSFSQFPPSYAVFGELETSDMPDPNPHGVSDTGAKLRSFVPFEKEQRSKLRAYTGPAFSETTQVMCMKPNMDAEIMWNRVSTELGNMPLTSISGSISYDDTFEEAALDNWTKCSSFQRFDDSSQTLCLPQNFSCSLPLIDMLTLDSAPVVALCHLSPDIVGDAEQTTTSSQVENIQMWNRSSALWSASANSWIFLTFSNNLTVTAVDEEIGPRDNATLSLSNPVAQNSEWQSYPVLPNEALNVSLCFAGVQADLFDVSMFTAADPREPEVQWDPVRRDDGAASGQVFMGTTDPPLNTAERGILSISDYTYPDGLNPDDISNSSRALWKGPSGFTGMFASSDGGSWIMCNLCVLNGWAIPPDIAALFTRTVHTTGRAAWAIQNFLTTYTESWYAQILPQFDVAADIDVTFSSQQRIPRHWGGLSAALIMVLVNLICVWAITVLYVVHTRYSRQGQVWHTVAQIMSEYTKPVLERSNSMRDNDVERRLDTDDYLVFIGRSKGSDKVSVLRS